MYPEIEPWNLFRLPEHPFVTHMTGISQDREIFFNIVGEKKTGMLSLT